MTQKNTDKTTFRQFNLKLRIFAALFGIAIPSNVEYSETDEPIPDRLTIDENVPTLADKLSGSDGTGGKWIARALIMFVALLLIISGLFFWGIIGNVGSTIAKSAGWICNADNDPVISAQHLFEYNSRPGKTLEFYLMYKDENDEWVPLDTPSSHADITLDKSIKKGTLSVNGTPSDRINITFNGKDGEKTISLSGNREDFISSDKTYSKMLGKHSFNTPDQDAENEYTGFALILYREGKPNWKDADTYDEMEYELSSPGDHALFVYGR